VFILQKGAAYSGPLKKNPYLRLYILQDIGVDRVLGAQGSVGPTPIHPELGGEKAEGIEELYGSPSGISILVPGNMHTPTA